MLSTLQVVGSIPAPSLGVTLVFIYMYVYFSRLYIGCGQHLKPIKTLRRPGPVSSEGITMYTHLSDKEARQALAYYENPDNNSITTRTQIAFSIMC